MKLPETVKSTYLRQFHVHQINGYACSAASVAMVINTILHVAGEKTASNLVTQQELLDKVATTFWKDQLSHRGHNGRHGVSLKDLKTVCVNALRIFGISYERIDLFNLNEALPDLKKQKMRVRHHLSQMAASNHDYILAYFTQGEVIGEWFGSHVSPIGTYDEKRDAVLILDVDPEVEGPYYTPFDHFFEGLLGKRNIFHRRGGGWVRIRVSPQM